MNSKNTALLSSTVTNADFICKGSSTSSTDDFADDADRGLI